MISPSSGNRYILAIFLHTVVLVAAIFLTQPLWVKSALIILLTSSLSIISIAYIRSLGLARLAVRLYAQENSRDRSLANAFIHQLISESGSGKSRSAIVAEMIASKFKLEKFVVFFRDGDMFIPGIYAGFNPSELNRPRASRIRFLLKEIDSAGKFTKKDEIFGFLFRQKDWEYFESPAAFGFKWGRFSGVIIAADDENGLLTETVSDPEFNRSVWPFLYNYIQQDDKLRESTGKNNKLQGELVAAKKDISGLNRDLNKKTLDLRSFVEVSGKLYTIFNEVQLFKTLEDTVRERLGADKTEILYFDGNGKFTANSPENVEKNIEKGLSIDSDSDFFKMLAENVKPLLLPVVSSGLESEPFLDNAIKNGFLVASGIRVGNKMGCVLLVSERKDKKQYSSSDIDFISIISNIASLSLENIRQYTTIEKLSYTDSMTGIYNYRYFYKRLIEEILRAKRFGRKLALVILDIDNFKLFNDTYGHQTGDLVLKKMASIITDTVRSIDVVSRYGGEEFCIIMPDTDVESCAKFIERLRSEIAGFRLESEIVKDVSVVTASVGGAVYPVHSSNADRLIYCADMALLKAKTSGRNLAVMCQPDFTDKEESSIGGIEE